MRLYCKKCNNELTNENLTKALLSELSDVEGNELLPKAKYIEVKKSEYNFTIKVDVLVHTKSINVIDHDNHLRLQGCCGPSEFGVLNQICSVCKTEIGVLIDDCWTQKFIGIDLSKVFVKPLSNLNSHETKNHTKVKRDRTRKRS